MCDPLTIAVVAMGVGQAAGGIMSAVGQAKGRDAQSELAKRNARLQRGQVYDQLQQETEANAQKNLELARAAQTARGAVKASNLADRSVRAIGRSIGFQLGSDQATVARNQEIAQQQAAARLTGIDISLQSQKAQIGDTSGLTLGLDIGSAVIGSAMSTAMLGSSLGLGSPAAPPPPKTLDASTTMDYAIV